MFLQTVVVIIKFIRDDEILSVLPSFIGVSLALIVMFLNQRYKLKLGKCITLLLLLNLAMVNIFEERNQLVSFMKYLLIGKFIGKYCTELCSSLYYLSIILIAFGCEGFFYNDESYYTIALGGWFILFFIAPSIMWRQATQSKQEFKAIGADNSVNKDIQILHESSLRPEKQQDQKHLDGSNPSYPSDFYQSMLQMYPEGIIILGQNHEVKLMSKSLKSLIGIRQKARIIQFIMGLQNNQEEIKRQEQMNTMFLALSSKLTSNIDCLQSDYVNEPFEMTTKLSESETIEIEFNKIMNEQLKELQKKSRYVKQDQQMKFIYEVTMICKSEIQTQQQYMKQPTGHSGYKGPTLFEVSLRPFIFQNEPFIFTIIKDVTHFNQIKVLQTINQNKSDMLAQVSHEFRTPLNCIMLLVETLQEQLSKELVEEYLQPIMISAKTLLSLINDLLDIAQLKAGKFRLANSEMDIKELLIEIEKFISPQLNQKGNKLQIQLIGRPSTKISSDPNRIRQIIYNLLSNANKFTQHGQISIILEQISERQYNIAVQDTGVGISQVDQSKLFQAFGKLDNNKEMNVQGVGLGLMISNVLAERLSVSDGIETMSGAQNKPQGLKVHSEGQGKGTCFSFQIFDQSQECPAYHPESKYTILIGDAPINDNKTTISRTKTKLDRQFDESTFKRDVYIMIVDDEPFNVHALRKALSKQFTVDGFFGGQDAINRIKQPLPMHTIILQDIEMPMMDGFETTKQIREIIDQKVYIIGCSGHSQSMRHECLEKGMNNFLQKPVKLTELMKIIDSLF